MKLFDSHTHTTNSHDGKISPEERVLCAIGENLDGVFITDHADFPNLNIENAKKAVDEAKRLKEKYKDKIYVGAGLEVGGSMLFFEKTKQMLDLTKNADAALLSVHNVLFGNDKTLPHHGAISSSPDYEQSKTYLKYYIENLLFLSKNADFDLLCHLTYPLRYFIGNHGYDIDIWIYEREIKQIFENLIKKDICLELNLSAMFTDWQTYVPDEKFLLLYKSLGGKLICLSTDSHTDQKVRPVMENAVSFLRSLGFKSYFYYKNHTPNEVKIL